MPLQRACAGGSQVRNNSSNGPLRVWWKCFAEYIITCGHTSVVGDMLVSFKSAFANQGGTADRSIRPWLNSFMGNYVKAFFIFGIFASNTSYCSLAVQIALSSLTLLVSPQICSKISGRRVHICVEYCPLPPCRSRDRRLDCPSDCLSIGHVALAPSKRELSRRCRD